MPWWFHVVESNHDLQNPTSNDKIRLLGERLCLGPGSHVLDLASGRGGPAVLLAQTFGCKITCVERSSEFVAAASQRAKAVGVDRLVDVVNADAGTYPIDADQYDAALCLGASFIWGGPRETVITLTEGVRTGGFVAVGEPYWRTWPLPEDVDPGDDYDFVTLAETVERFESAGIELVTLIASSRNDWDRYESLHWTTLEEWLRDNPNHQDAARYREMGRKYRDDYLRWQRDLLGWAIFVGRKR